MADPGWSASAAFADLDGDADLDLYVVNYLGSTRRPPPRAGNGFNGVAVMAGPRGLAAQPDTLYENLGDGVSRRLRRRRNARVRRPADFGLVVRILDFDGDGRLDLFVGNDSTADQLFRNLGGRFEEVAAAPGSRRAAGGPEATMGLAPRTSTATVRRPLHHRVLGRHQHAPPEPRRRVVRRSFLAVRARRRQPAVPLLGCGFFDFDLDGDEDLLVANGHVYPEMESPALAASWAQELLLYERRGRRFERAPDAGEPFRRRFHGGSVAFGDFDGDHDVDAVVTTLNGRPLMLRNDGTPGAGLAVELVAPPPNLHAYGAVVDLESAAGEAAALDHRRRKLPVGRRAGGVLRAGRNRLRRGGADPGALARRELERPRGRAARAAAADRAPRRRGALSFNASQGTVVDQGATPPTSKPSTKRSSSAERRKLREAEDRGRPRAGTRRPGR